MKLSMWMIMEKMKKYSPKYDIKDGKACILGIRFFSGEEAVLFESQYVYLCLDTEMFHGDQPSQSAALMNGRDIIILHSNNVNDILNDLLAVFDFYNSWEASVWEATAHKSFQRVVDLGTTVLENPVMLADSSGSVLAMSSAFREDDINEYWVEARNTNRVPTAILGAPMRTLDGEISSWTDEPREYLLPNGTATIGVFLTVDNEAVAGLGIWQYKNPIKPGDLWLAKILYNALLSMIGDPKERVPLRSSPAIIGDLLSGTEIDGTLLEKLELRCRGPWKLLVIDNPFHIDVVYKRSIVQQLRNSQIPCVPLIYEEHVVALVSGDRAGMLTDSVIGTREKQYYLAGLSLPFDNLRNTSARYQQTLFAIGQAGGRPGIYQGEDYALPYLLSVMGEQNAMAALTHPALNELRRYDAEKHSELYDTLYYYLLYERSILLGSQAMHIHRNSFMYRIQRIKEMTGLDLDDPMLRIYLLLSFLLEKVDL